MDNERQVATNKLVISKNAGEADLATAQHDFAEALIAAGLSGIDIHNIHNVDLDEAIARMKLSLTEALPELSSNDRMLYLSRGNGKVKWFFDAEKGHYLQKDEYAENVPEAMLRACGALGWTGIVMYEGRAPDFDETHPNFETIFPGTAIEFDYSALGVGASQLRTAAQKYFSDQWAAVQADPNWQEVFSYRGVPFYDQLDPLVASFAAKMGSTFVSEYARWKAVFQTLKPRVIFGGRLDSRVPLMVAAKEEGVVTANIKLGIGEEMLAPFYIRDQTGAFDEKVMADIQLIWGQRQEKMLDKRFAAHPSKWIPVGRTRNDSFVGEEVVTEAGLLYRFLGLNDEAEVILYGANHRTFFARDAGDSNGICCMSWLSYTENLAALEAFAETRPNTYIIVKPHPSDDIEKITEFVELSGDRVRLVTNASGLHNSEILLDSKIFISSVSSMFSEALVSETLPISLWLDDMNFLYESERRDMFDAMAVTVQSTQDLIETTLRYLDDKAAWSAMIDELQAGLSGYFGAVDGYNADRAIYETLKDMAADNDDLKRRLGNIELPYRSS